jgi:hypothetical protein|eukprot:SAG25_NODE_950_length_4609_cov_3.139024_3_plen_55_part_00
MSGLALVTSVAVLGSDTRMLRVFLMDMSPLLDMEECSISTQVNRHTPLPVNTRS